MWTREKSSTAGDSQPIPAATRSGPGPRPEPETMVTMQLGASVVIKGHLAASEDLTIHGSFDGTIEVRDHSVTVGHHAHINGPILAKSVFIEGTVDGDVTATCKVEIRDTGQLRGDIVSPRLAVVDGARVNGRVEVQAAVGAKLRIADAAPVAPDEVRDRKSPAA